MAVSSNATDDVRTRPSASRRWRIACVSALAIALLEVVALGTGGTGEAASPPVDATFNAPTQLVGTAGATPSAAVVDSSGRMLVIGSTTASDGCTLSTVSRNGASTAYLGRTPGGADCTLTTLAQSPSANGLAVVSQSSQGLVGGSSSNGGSSFAWSAMAGIGTPKALVADPAPTAGGSADLFLLVQSTQTGLPYIAVSTNAGMTFVLGSPLINPADIPAASWSGPNHVVVAGNIVARRTPTGLQLYSVLETGVVTATQWNGSTSVRGVLTQVYEAVGTVSAATPTNPRPSIAWREGAVYSAPAGTSLDPRGAVTTVDGLGRVYTAFTDGRHLYVKVGQTGLGFNVAAAPVTIDTAASGIPAGSDAAFDPVLAAGGNGMVDVAWLTATGGAASAPGALRTWSVFMAQTLDAGRSWRAYPVSGTAVHRGTEAGSVQVVVDPTSGAASLSYSSDLATPGMPSLYATRQCSGFSATTGRALADTCAVPGLGHSALPGTSLPATVLPGTVLPGTTCSGPQVRNRAFNAVHNGVNIAALDVYTARFFPVDSSTEAVTITVARINSGLPTGVTEALWRATWTQGDNDYYAQAAMAAGRPTYSVGIMNADGTPGPGTGVSGSMANVADGSNTGAITITIPLAAVGSPAPGTLMDNIAAASLAVFKGSIATPQLVDRAPDGSATAAFRVLQACPPNMVVPEVPAAALLPLVGAAGAIAVALGRRRRSRRAASG
jgi:hypothetical protein